MHVDALTAHGHCDLREAEALVLAWFESEGLELAHGQGGLLIGWTDATLSPLAVEVRFYDLGGGWLQARWTLRPAQGESLATRGTELLASLRRRLAAEPRWQIDGP